MRPATLACAAGLACFHLFAWILAFLFVLAETTIPLELILRTALFDTGSWLLVGSVGAAAGWLLPVAPGKRFSVPHFLALCAGGLVLVAVRLWMVQLFAVYGDAGGAMLLHHVRVPQGQRPALLSLFVENYPWNLMIATSYIALGAAVRGVGRYHARERELARLDAGLAEVRFAVLRSRLHPRVLLAMRYIASEIEADGPGANGLLAGLSDFLRHQLERARLKAVALKDEIAFAREYVELERSCCGLEVEVELAASPALMNVLVPTGCVTVVVEALLAARTSPRAPRTPVRILVSAAEPGRAPLQISVDGLSGADLQQLLAAAAQQEQEPSGIADTQGGAYRSPMHIPAPTGLVVVPVPERGAQGASRGGILYEAGREATEQEPSARWTAPQDERILQAARRWLLWYLVIFAGISISHDFVLASRMLTGPELARSLAMNLGCMVIWMAVSGTTLGLARKIGPLDPRRIVLGTAVAAVLGCANHLLQTVVWCWQSTNGYCYVNSLPGLPSTVSITLSLFAVGLITRAAATTAGSDRRASVIRAETMRSRTLVLEQQLRPHFLFNTLQSITTLIHRDRAAASAMLLGLRELLLHSLAASGRAEVSLDAELRATRLYLDIETRRFSDKLCVEFAVDPAALGASVPPFLLQPLAENAVHHAVAARGEGRIRIAAAVDPHRRWLSLAVEDDGSGQNRPRRAGPNGIGLENARARLRHLYGDASTLELVVREQAGARVSITIPFRAPPPPAGGREP